MVACVSCGRENREGARFCDGCGASLPGVVAAAEARKPVTVLFCDVVGSTELGERLDPEVVRATMARYFEAARGVIQRHGGTVEKFIGDAVMAVFGVPRVHEDDALRAVRAAHEVLAVLTQVGVVVRVGLASGEAVTGNGETFGSGDVFNVAARLQAAAAPGEVLLSDATRRLVRDAALVDELPPLQLKGKRESVTAWRLREVLVHDSGRSDRLPLVGRVRELSLFADAFGRAVADRNCNLLTVFGEPGVGKSRLFREATQRLPAPVAVVEGRCLPYGDGITFWPVAQIVKAVAEISPRDPPDEAKRKIRGVIGGGRDADAAVELVAGLIGVQTGLSDVPSAFWGLRRFIEAAAQQTPLVVLVDDLQWADPGLLDLIEHLADWTSDAPVLIACTARLDLLDIRPGWGGGKLNANSILLQPLSPRESAALLTHLLHEGEPASADVQQQGELVEVAGGNPLFLEELAAFVSDMPAATNDDAIPPTIHALLAARLDRLNEQERVVLAAAAVEGEEFDRDALAALAPTITPNAIDGALAQLARHQLVRVGGQRNEGMYRFHHLLVRDAAYAAIPKARRAELHEAFANWLAQTTSQRAGEYEIIGYHFERAYQLRRELFGDDAATTSIGRRAAVVLTSAGRAAFSRGDSGAAAQLLERAAALLPADTAEYGEVLLSLVDALMENGEWHRARQQCDVLVDVAETAADAQLEAHATIRRAYLELATKSDSRASTFSEDVHRALRVLEEADDSLGVAKGHELLGAILTVRGEVGPAREALDKALSAAALGNDERLEGRILERIGTLQFRDDTPISECLRWVDETLEWARKRRNRMMEAQASGASGSWAAQAGDLERGRRLLAQSKTIFEELGLPTWVAHHYAGNAAGVELLAGNYETAEGLLREHLPIIRSAGDRADLVEMLSDLAQAVYRRGRLDEALDIADEVASAANDDELWPQVTWRTIKARVFARRGRIDEGLELARDAVARTETTRDLSLRADVLLAFAEVLTHAEEREHAQRIVDQALALLRAKGNTIAAQRALELSNALATSTPDPWQTTPVPPAQR